MTKIKLNFGTEHTKLWQVKWYEKLDCVISMSDLEHIDWGRVTIVFVNLVRQ